MLALRDGERDGIQCDALVTAHGDIFQFDERGQVPILILGRAQRIKKTTQRRGAENAEEAQRKPTRCPEISKSSLRLSLRSLAPLR